MASGKTVFILGAGFIGLNVLDLLVAEGYTVTALTRRDEHAAELAKLGAKTVKGGLKDHDLIASQVASSDIVFHMATADDLPSVLSVLAGVRQRAEQGKSIIYIHTSGSANLSDNAQGMSLSDKIYSDATPADMDSVPDDNPHRQIDLKIVRTAKELGEKAKIVIVSPPMIYGYNPAHGRQSIQIPTLTRFALKHGWAGYVGKGLNVWSQIHVRDLARGFVTVLHYLENASPGEALQNPYFFCENGEGESMKAIAEHIAGELHEAGRIQNLEPKTIPKDLWKDVFGEHTPVVAGLNSRCRADRLRKLGWEPKEKSLWQSYREDELPEILKEDCSKFQGYGAPIAS